MQNPTAARAAIFDPGRWGKFVTDRAENQTLASGSDSFSVGRMPGRGRGIGCLGGCGLKSLPEAVMVNNRCHAGESQSSAERVV